MEDITCEGCACEGCSEEKCPPPYLYFLTMFLVAMAVSFCLGFVIGMTR